LILEVPIICIVALKSMKINTQKLQTTTLQEVFYLGSQSQNQRALHKKSLLAKHSTGNHAHTQIAYVELQPISYLWPSVDWF